MSTRFAARSLDLACSVLLEAAVVSARARLAGPGDVGQHFDANAADMLVALAAVELIDSAGGAR